MFWELAFYLFVCLFNVLTRLPRTLVQSLSGEKGLCLFLLFLYSRNVEPPSDLTWSNLVTKKINKFWTRSVSYCFKMLFLLFHRVCLPAASARPARCLLLAALPVFAVLGGFPFMSTGSGFIWLWEKEKWATYWLDSSQVIPTQHSLSKPRPRPKTLLFSCPCSPQYTAPWPALWLLWEALTPPSFSPLTSHKLSGPINSASSLKDGPFSIFTAPSQPTRQSARPRTKASVASSLLCPFHPVVRRGL